MASRKERQPLDIASFSDGSAQAFAIHARTIEATGMALPRREHRADPDDPACSRLGSLGPDNPLNLVLRREGRDGRPSRADTCVCGGQYRTTVRRQLRFRSFVGCQRCEFNDNAFAKLGTGGFSQLPAHLEPVSALAVWLERGPKAAALDSASH